MKDEYQAPALEELDSTLIVHGDEGDGSGIVEPEPTPGL